MALSAAIGWAEATWNFLVGCTEISPACKNCYARRLHGRLGRMGQTKYSKPFHVVRSWLDHLELPLQWKVAQLVFVNSMSDMFHEAVLLDDILKGFAVMARADWHIFQILTKRAERLAKLAPLLPWMRHVWMGVSIESREYLHRLDDLRKVPAAVRFVSFEPLLGPIGTVDLSGISWVIVGGESGPGARPMDLDWVRDLRNQCVSQGVAFFFKQLGGRNGKHVDEAVLHGRYWHEMPRDYEGHPALTARAKHDPAHREIEDGASS